MYSVPGMYRELGTLLGFVFMTTIQSISGGRSVVSVTLLTDYVLCPTHWQMANTDLKSSSSKTPDPISMSRRLVWCLKMDLMYSWSKNSSYHFTTR